ncbi:hypothetical protein V1264_003090 [Littorina saxatilis]|uniref:Thiamine pyrophosphate enzyme TPP-binding domain-containing protein n=1 Tax=Littorina saxatilis TaxID=31220 RepID=A0AAN9G9J8_9CAEN
MWGKTTFTSYISGAWCGKRSVPLRRSGLTRPPQTYVRNRSCILAFTTFNNVYFFSQIREKNQMGHKQEFLTVGAMGHASCIALTIALNKPDRKVVALDGDGAVLMHMGTLATIGQRGPPNFHHVVFNNGAHDSVGGQPTHASCHHTFSITDIARACGYNKTFCVSTEEEIEAGMKRLMGQPGPVLMEVKIRTGSRSDLGRPTRTTFQNKDEFMEFVRS